MKTAVALALILSLGAISAHAAPANKPDFLGKSTVTLAVHASTCEGPRNCPPIGPKTALKKLTSSC
jgi:hypothetical protein